MVQKHMQDVAHGFRRGHDATVSVELNAPVPQAIDFTQPGHVVGVLVVATGLYNGHSPQVGRIPSNERIKDRKVGYCRCESLFLFQLGVGFFVSVLVV